MKKLTALILALLMMFAFVACGSSDKDDADKKDFLKSFIDSIEVFPKRGPAKGKIIRVIHFNFPMYMKDGQMYKTVSFDEPDDGDDENGGNGGSGFPTLGGPRGAGGL